MSGNAVRYGATDPSEPTTYDLPSLRIAGDEIVVRIVVRRAEDGTWRARLLFGEGDVATAPATAEIFCALSETELWESVHDLRAHHVRDLWRSLTGTESSK
ncbi:MAG TPA: hypothetical protein VGA22_11325 [Gemmatimonadales bacterium]|jgi:hypothetical protein